MTCLAGFKAYDVRGKLGEELDEEIAYCDNGMVPWPLVWPLVAELVNSTGKPLSKVLGERMTAYPCGSESNYKAENAQTSFEAVKAHFASSNAKTEYTDGIGLELSDWHLNLRTPNSEPLLRLKLQSLGDSQLAKVSLDETQTLIKEPV